MRAVAEEEEHESPYELAGHGNKVVSNGGLFGGILRFDVRERLLEVDHRCGRGLMRDVSW